MFCDYLRTYTQNAYIAIKQLGDVVVTQKPLRKHNYFTEEQFQLQTTEVTVKIDQIVSCVCEDILYLTFLCCLCDYFLRGLLLFQ